MDVERLQEGFRHFPPVDHPWHCRSHPPRSTIPWASTGTDRIPLLSQHLSTARTQIFPTSSKPQHFGELERAAGGSGVEWDRIQRRWIEGRTEPAWPGAKRPLVFGFHSQTSRKALSMHNNKARSHAPELALGHWNSFPK